MIYLVSLAFTLSFIYYSKYQFEDDRGASQGKWHIYGMIMRILAVVSPFIMQLYPATWDDYLLAGIVNIIVWEAGINLIALRKKWHYQGKTSYWDKFFGDYEWWIYGLILAIAAGVKIFMTIKD